MAEHDETDGGAAVARLRAEVADLRLKLADEVRTRRMVIVDDVGIARIRLTTAGPDARIVLLDEDGFERITLTAKPDIGTVAVAARSRSPEPTRVDVFALDPEDADPAYIGIELVDQGNTTAAFAVYEGRPA